MKKVKFAAVFSAAISLFIGLGSFGFIGRVSAATPAGTETAKVNAAGSRVVGYLPDWSYRAYKKLDFTALTHINISFCNPDANGKLKSDIPDEEMNAIVGKAHENGVKVLAALGGGGGCGGYYDFVSTAEKQASFNENIRSFCRKYALDGVDLDIELDSSDKIWAPYASWVNSLREICDGEGWLLSTATAQWVAGGVSAETFALFDYVNVMAYDNDGTDADGIKSHASYDFAVECLQYFRDRKNVPAEKLTLGVPFYGRGYSEDGSLDWNSYRSFADIVAVNAANFNADVYDGVAYNGAETMRRKCALAKAYGGIMIWEITQDGEGEYSLLKLIKEELLPTDDAQTPDQTSSSSAPDKNTGCGAVYSGAAVGGIVTICGGGIVYGIRKRKR